MKTKLIIFAVVLFGNMLSARAQDDLYYNPKSRSSREIDIKKNPDERYVAPPVPSSTPPPHRDVWGDGDVDSVGEDDALIYEITDDRQAYNDDRSGDEELSYEQRLRFDDPTYVVVYRDPYWDYPYYGGWGGYYRSGWGWGLGWGLWGGYYGWNYPYYHYPYYHHHYHYPYYSHHYANRNVTHYHRGGTTSRPNNNTGYTRSTSSGRGGVSSLSVPNSRGQRQAYTRSTTSAPAANATRSSTTSTRSSSSSSAPRSSSSSSTRSAPAPASSSSSTRSSSSYSGGSSSTRSSGSSYSGGGSSSRSSGGSSGGGASSTRRR